ncbi:MAG: hypothetical protein J6R79_05040 [Bacteroidaceae bacterium]|nr:hypothetical protein [Bacteroidaceae bacterium]
MSNSFKVCFALLSTFILCVACTSKEEQKRAEAIEQGHLLIEQAREAYRQNNYDQAIALIDSIRHAYPTAMNAREAGILLKDSIEIAKAEAEFQEMYAKGITTGDDVEEVQRRIKYFMRKLKHDQEQQRTH